MQKEEKTCTVPGRWKVWVVRKVRGILGQVRCNGRGERRLYRSLGGKRGRRGTHRLYAKGA